MSRLTAELGFQHEAGVTMTQFTEELFLLGKIIHAWLRTSQCQQGLHVQEERGISKQIVRPGTARKHQLLHYTNLLKIYVQMARIAENLRANNTSNLDVLFPFLENLSANFK
jgi:hypothetical protein